MVPFYPTVFLNLLCLGLEIFFAFLHYSYWIKQKTNKNHLFLFFWFIIAILHSTTRVIQYLTSDPIKIVIDAKLGAITNYLIIWVSINFVNYYSRYKASLKEKFIWSLLIIIPVYFIIFTNIYITNSAVLRHTIFGEIFYGAGTGPYYLIWGAIRPASFLFLFFRLVKAKNIIDKSWFVVMGFMVSVIFTLNDTMAIYLELTWLRLNDYSYVFLGVGYTLAMVKHYNKLYNSMEVLVEERTAELKRSEELYRKLVTTVPDLIVRTDLSGTILFINESSVPFIKSISSENFLGKNILDFVVDEDKERAVHNFQQRRDGQIGLYEYRLKYGEGETVYCEINGEVLRDHNEKPFGMVFVLRDVTDRKRNEEIISASLKEKEVLLKEIYHRTKNNMQVICSIIGLQTLQMKDEEAIAVLKETENRIYAMSLVHQKLYQSSNLSRIDLKSYINDLCAQLDSTYEIFRRNISIELKLESINVLIDTAIPLGLILNELITNSIKHAFADRSNGRIEILLWNDNQQIHLEMKDDGVGFNQDYDLENSKSLGLKILYQLVTNQLKGSIELKSNNGAHYSIVFDDTLYTERV